MTVVGDNFGVVVGDNFGIVVVGNIEVVGSNFGNKDEEEDIEVAIASGQNV